MTDQARFEAIILERCNGFATLSSGQLGALFAHFELMRRWNPKLNLTSCIDLEAAALRHYAESLFLGSFLPKSMKTAVDMGSGAGFPGFPVAVLRAEFSVLLVESDQRKAAFLREASDFAKNVRVRAVRAETLTDAVDAVIGRAVVPKDILAVADRISVWFGILASCSDAEAIAGSRDCQVAPLPWDPDSVAIHGVVPRGTHTGE